MQKKKNITEKILKSVILENGLTLQFCDKSRIMVGDRWRIVIVAFLEISVKTAFIGETNDLSISLDEIEELLGESIYFEKKIERSFVDENEKDNTIKDIMESLFATLLPYLNHPQFCRQFIIKEFLKARHKKLLHERI